MNLHVDEGKSVTEGCNVVLRFDTLARSVGGNDVKRPLLVEAAHSNSGRDRHTRLSRGFVAQPSGLTNPACITMQKRRLNVAVETQPLAARAGSNKVANTNGPRLIKFISLIHGPNCLKGAHQTKKVDDDAI